MTETISAVESQISDEFNSWLKRTYRKGHVAIPVISSVIWLLTVLITYSTKVIKNEWLELILLLVHCFICLVLLFLIPVPQANVQLSKRASTAVEQFLQTWQSLWFFWFILYLGFSCEAASHYWDWYKNAGSGDRC